MRFLSRDYRWNLNTAGPTTRGSAEADLMIEMGRDLRSVYTDVLKEPLPEHLACIVRKLEQRDQPRN